MSAPEQELSGCIKQLNETEKKSVLLMLKTFLKGQDEDAGGISIEQYNREIDAALAEIEAGNYITREEFEKQAAKW